MASATWYFQNSFHKKLMEGTIHLLNGGDTFHMLLVDDGHTPDVDTFDFVDDVVGDELAAAGNYARQALANQAVAPDNPNNRAVWSADDPTIANSTFTWRYAYLFKWTGADGTSALLGYFDPGGNMTYAAQTFRLDFASAGIFALGS